jgi:hypothetical protein
MEEGGGDDGDEDEKDPDEDVGILLAGLGELQRDTYAYEYQLFRV